MPPITVAPLIDCSQPAAETLSAAEKLPEIPVLSTDPREAIDALSEVIKRDGKVYADEVDKRQTLIVHGVMRCKWTR